ncbi:MAG TPA: trypsin-like peptidase domain-containing protein [Tepidisphaeraceae bacterium]|jgi:serine protease Do|nr:trypsin-like peptidase domain-containing protein [Tepidisphaeraceae bacterium]
MRYARPAHRRCLVLLMVAVTIGGGIATARSQDGTINLRRTVAVDVVDKTKDAVVNIAARRFVNQRVNALGGNPMFDTREVVKVPSNSLGSGIIVHADGYVVTNNHVVDRARQVIVEMNDGRKLPATLISADAGADLAILKITTDQPLPAIPLGDSSDLMIGEPVIAVGNALGFSHTVSTGIVSAMHRDLRENNGTVLLTDLIQTDAAINPGNSGGPLLNAYGQVIGINTAIRGDAQNIGFAVPVNKLRELIPELMSPAVVSKMNIPIKLGERRTLTPPATVTTEVIADDGAPITAINGSEVKDIVDAYVQLLKVGRDVKEVTLRMASGQQRRIEISPVPLPDALVRARETLGVTIEPLTPMLANRYRLQTEEGLIVTAVEPATAAANAGLQPGDVIVQMGRYRVSTLEDFSALLQHLPASGRVRVGVVRGDRFGVAVIEF